MGPCACQVLAMPSGGEPSRSAVIQCHNMVARGSLIMCHLFVHAHLFMCLPWTSNYIPPGLAHACSCVQVVQVCKFAHLPVSPELPCSGRVVEV